MVRLGLSLKLVILIIKICEEKNGRNESDNCESVQQVIATTSSILHPYIVESSGKSTNIIFLNLQYLKF